MSLNPAAPDTWWPAGEAGIVARRIEIATGLSVRVVSAGPLDGPPVVMVHGWGVHAYLWRRNIPALVAVGMRVHAVDLPGHGLSDRPLDDGSYALDRMTAHLDATFDALGVKRAVVVAQSMGGRIATELARLFPSRVRALVLVGSVGFGEVPRIVALAPHLPAPVGPLSGLMIKRWMVALGKAFAYGRRARIDQRDVDAYWAAMQHRDFVPAMRRALIDFDWRELGVATMPEITVPVLVVFGTRDRTVRPLRTEALVRALPRGELRWIRDAGHLPNEEVPEEVNALLVEFISRAE